MSVSVSVIIPAHRVDRWLDEAVQSALASEDVDVEVVVVLNGVPLTVQPDWREDRRVTLLHAEEPLGPTRAMIRGIEASQGRHIARLDADDRMSPVRLRSQLAWLEEHPATTLVGTAAQRIGPDGEPLGSIRMPTGPDIRSSLVLFNSVPHSSVLFRRSDLDAAGGYDEALNQMEDYDVILRLGQRGAVAVLPEELTFYRVHPSQISRGAKPYGAHIRAIGRQRRRLGRAIGMSAIAVGARAAVWRGVQFSRYLRVTKPGHEY